jgi:hypothetical protein
MVQQKHVQLAIKYSQLEKKTQWQAKALELLLKPYRTEFAPRLDMHPEEKGQEIGHFQWYPKVVSGRYLTFSQRSFINNWRPELVRWSKLGCFGSCMHQYTDPVRYAHFLARQTATEDPRRGGLISSFRRRRLRARPQPESSDIFFECIQKAFDEHGTWFDGACHLCLTEFSIFVRSGNLHLQTWRDLGGADSPRNEIWQGHTDDFESGAAGIERCPREIRSRYRGRIQE